MGKPSIRTLAALASLTTLACRSQTSSGSSQEPACGTVCEAGPCPVALASGQQVNPFHSGITTYGSTLYWATYTAISAVDSDGGAVIALAPGPSTTSGIAVDAAHVYWADAHAGTIMAIPRGGGTPSTLASGLLQPVGLAVQGDSLYVSTLMDGLVQRVPILGGSATPIGAARLPRNVVLDAMNVYWTDEDPNGMGSVMKLPLAGGTATPLAPPASGQIFGLAVDTANVYWARYADGTILKAPIAAPALPTTLATGQSPTAIATDGASVYWMNSAGAVIKISRDGGTPTALNSGSCASWGLALDSSSAYWITTDGAVAKLMPR